jgi:hypothetical protein
MIPPSAIERHGKILVVRDDRVPGGTKQRVLPGLLDPGREYVYASPAYGYAQVALAHACREVGSRATVFTAKRGKLHPRTTEAKRAGAKVVLVPTGYLSNVQAKARAYCGAVGASFLPFGFDSPEFRAVQAAWPGARFHAVRVGKPPDVGWARLYEAPEPFERDASLPPPFPSCSNYDAKAWRFLAEHARPGALFWNVAG